MLLFRILKSLKSEVMEALELENEEKKNDVGCSVANGNTHAIF